MHKGSGNCLFKILITLLFVICSISSFSQPPVKDPVAAPPTSTEPVNMTKPQLETFFKDQNSEPGKDRNADLNKNEKVSKDSSARDNNNVKFNDPKGTYGANASIAISSVM